ncbi:uncharacterized protein KZ484_012752 isoform 2-T3 [Pholidichthys leucotaenia]
MKCVVSGCPNRVGSSYSLGNFHQPPKRFFGFPDDPIRVKMWLAALRQSANQDSDGHPLICEDHFLPADITGDGVCEDAIPLMPLYLDRPDFSWGGGEEEENKEEDQWGGRDEDCEDGEVRLNGCEDNGGDIRREKIQDPGGMLENPPESGSFSGFPQQSHQDSADALNRSLDLRETAKVLQTPTQTLQNLVDILEEMGLVHRESSHTIKWTGRTSVSHFLFRTAESFQSELNRLTAVDRTLDTIIKTCAQQLFDLTENAKQRTWAYVTVEDIRRLSAFQDQMVVIIRAPEETTLEVREPAEVQGGVEIHLKAMMGPIMVMSMETSDPTEKRSGCLISMEEARIRTSTLHTVDHSRG